MPERPAPDLTKALAGKQQEDGSWKVGAQFFGMRRDAKETTSNIARQVLLGLATPDADPSVLQAAQAKAKSLLEKDEAPKSVETLAFRALYTQRFGTAEESGKLRSELVKLQHPDGGWSWAIENAQSDCLATGEALYVLQQSGDPTAAEAIGKGRRWLLDQQGEDGGWPVDITRLSKGDRSAPAKAKSLKDATVIYTIWGSAWATIGLLEGLPLAEKPTATASP
jgi:hypothetical protein